MKYFFQSFSFAYKKRNRKRIVDNAENHILYHFRIFDNLPIKLSLSISHSSSLLTDK